MSDSTGRNDAEVGDLSAGGTHYWDGDVGQWRPLWLAHDNVIKAVRRCYGRRATSASFLGDGQVNQSWRVSAGDDVAVLRVSRPERSHDQLAYEHSVTAILTAHLPFVVAPLSGRDGGTVQRFEGKLLSLFPFVTGTSGSAMTSADRCREAAQSLAQIHRVSLDRVTLGQRQGFRPSDDRSCWIWSQVRPVLDGALPPTNERAELFAVFDREMARLDAWLAEFHASRRPLTRAAIHGDYNPRNMIFRGRRIAAVIDWDHCCLDAIASEVAAAGLNQLDVSPTVFWETYLDSGGPLTADDVDLLGGFACIDVLSDVQWAIGNGRVEPDALGVLHDVATRLDRVHKDEANLRSRHEIAVDRTVPGVDESSWLIPFRERVRRTTEDCGQGTV